eukprot:CAMPEP_0198292426 /NCGR_PEP_ID=MMETSP1449-20131203/11995_1 /TAXON_ID=420275 /ORGANISM="Attheya septentrionalis, Strain CCMP2084" /LENGTH=366 /DNA_ID=CAMNT_0043991459 /DNA_START=212 /DNA_END=1312 /DNA_ORIENTATION=+
MNGGNTEPLGSVQPEDAASYSTGSQFDDASGADVAPSSYAGDGSHYTDATKTVHEMHLALLYLLSNPDEFVAVQGRHNSDSTLAEWNAAYGIDEEASTSTAPPLPYVVFAEDAEVVLPQAHTASQLFGIERSEGIELEAAAGVQALSLLFLRWLALMPGGDHMNIIDPPGLTVMRIAGGRYRVTAAHRVVWKWMNQFSHDAMASTAEDGTDNPVSFEFGDLVTMTIVDVFETDSDGKLLSYCPTFDNRAIRKTTQASERIRKGSSKIQSSFKVIAKSPTASRVNKAASLLGKMGFRAAVTVKDSVGQAIEEQRKKTAREVSCGPISTSPETVPSAGDTVKEAKTNGDSDTRAENYISDDDETGDNR